MPTACASAGAKTKATIGGGLPTTDVGVTGLALLAFLERDRRRAEVDVLVYPLEDEARVALPRKREHALRAVNVR